MTKKKTVTSITSFEKALKKAKGTILSKYKSKELVERDIFELSTDQDVMELEFKP